MTLHCNCRFLILDLNWGNHDFGISSVLAPFTRLTTVSEKNVSNSSYIMLPARDRVPQPLVFSTTCLSCVKPTTSLLNLLLIHHFGDSWHPSKTRWFVLSVQSLLACRESPLHGQGWQGGCDVMGSVSRLGSGVVYCVAKPHWWRLACRIYGRIQSGLLLHGFSSRGGQW